MQSQIDNEYVASEARPDVATFESLESNVRTYCRAFPKMFVRGEGAYLFDHHGNRYLDFLSGAGALNYGHNHPALKRSLLRYIEENGVVSSLDLYTDAKAEFLQALDEIILKPRELNYRVQFCGPTGTNAVESALKLARKVTGRQPIISFSNSYHGMTSGSMGVSASARRRNEQYLNPAWVVFLPFDGFTEVDDELAVVRQLMLRRGSGIGMPAAFIVELVQGEGGVNIARQRWVREIHALCRELGALFIVDEIQSGCGRTGKFFSFEHHGIVPDIVCVSKSISGYGFPMSLVLMRPELDRWDPGEHNGTFRGFNYGFVTGARTLKLFWRSHDFQQSVAALSEQLARRLDELRRSYPQHALRARSLGMIAAIDTRNAEIASALQRRCFEQGLIVETCGPDGASLKLLPPLVVSSAALDAGLGVLQRAFAELPRVV